MVVLFFIIPSGTLVKLLARLANLKCKKWDGLKKWGNNWEGARVLKGGFPKKNKNSLCGFPPKIVLNYV